MTAASFTFKSSDGNGNLRDEMVAGRSVRNRKPPFRLAHGYAEHIGRYDVFARKLAEAGIVVYGNDHRGHGKTNGNVGEAICFADEAGFDKVVADMRALTEIIQSENPDIPLFLFGHSMGSMLTRRYIQLYGDDLVGAVLSGSGVVFEWIAEARHRRGSVGNQKKWSRPSKSVCWTNWSSRTSTGVSSPPGRIWIGSAGTQCEVDKFLADPLRGKIGSAGYFHDFFSGLLAMNDSANIQIDTEGLAAAFHFRHRRSGRRQGWKRHRPDMQGLPTCWPSGCELQTI